MKASMLAVAVLALGVLPTVAQAFVLGPTSPGKWGSPTLGTGATVTYSFMPTGVSCAAEGFGCTIAAVGDFGPSSAVWRAEISAAMAAWSAAADIKFVEVPDSGEAFNAPQLSGDIRIGGHVFDGFGGTLAEGYFPPVNGASGAGDLHFDVSECWEAAFDGAGDGCFSIFQVAAHYLGHILGLDHSGVPASLMNPFYTEAFAGPQDDDKAGVAFLYGPAASAPGGGGGGGGGSGGGGGTGVPEPMTLALLGVGLAAAALARRRR